MQPHVLPTHCAVVARGNVVMRQLELYCPELRGVKYVLELPVIFIGVTTETTEIANITKTGTVLQFIFSLESGHYGAIDL